MKICEWESRVLTLRPRVPAWAHVFYSFFSRESISDDRKYGVRRMYLYSYFIYIVTGARNVRHTYGTRLGTYSVPEAIGIRDTFFFLIIFLYILRPFKHGDIPRVQPTCGNPRFRSTRVLKYSNGLYFNEFECRILYSNTNKRHCWISLTTF